MTKKGLIHAGIGVLAFLAFFVIGTINLEQSPPLWGDEGWTLCVARNWVMLGHYGCLVAGQPAPSTLSAHFPVVASIAFSFYLLGVGIWQARIVGLFFTAGAMIGLYHLTGKLYNRSAALVTLIILLLFPTTRWEIHPLILGRQVLGEMPALFYLLAGYICFLSVRKRTWFFMPMAFCFWALALKTKAQVYPFWVVSLVIPWGVMVFKRRWQMAGLLAVGLFGSLGVQQLLYWGQQFILNGHTLSGSSLDGVYTVTAVVPVAGVRLATLRTSLLSCLPMTLGVGYAGWRWIVKQRLGETNPLLEMGQLMLWVLAGSWLAWFTLLSSGNVRYIFPSLFMAAPFISVMLYDLTDGFNLITLYRTGVSGLKARRLHWPKLQTVVAIFLIIWMGGMAGRAFYRFATSGEHDSSVLSAARFLNTSTPPNALIETNASELFFLLDRSYHYPPAQLYIDLDYRVFYQTDDPIVYDPLATNPDYLVTNPIGRSLQLYDPVIKAGKFRLLQTIGRYQIYERVR